MSTMAASRSKLLVLAALLAAPAFALAETTDWSPWGWQKGQIQQWVDDDGWTQPPGGQYGCLAVQGGSSEIGTRSWAVPAAPTIPPPTSSSPGRASSGSIPGSAADQLPRSALADRAWKDHDRDAFRRLLPRLGKDGAQAAIAGPQQKLNEGALMPSTRARPF